MKLSKLYIGAIVLAAIIAIWTVASAEPATLHVGGKTYQGEMTEVPATQPATQPGDVVEIEPPPATQPTTLPPTPASVRGASGVLKAIKLNGKPLRGSFELTDLLIDANGQSRVIEPSPGARQVLRNVKIVNVGRSVVERSVVFAATDKPYELVLENVSTENTPGYTVYLDAAWKDGKSMADGAMVHVTLARCDLGSSLYETVVRLMPGTDGTIDDCRIWDTVDLGADGKPTNPPNKAHSALRGHCLSLDASKCTVEGYAKFGFEKALAKRIRLQSVDFTGGVEFEGSVSQRVVTGCTLNGKAYR